MDPEVLYTPLEVAVECNISRRRIYDWIAAGWLRGRRIGGRWVVTAEDLEFFRETCRGAEGRLMPQLWDWDPIWQDRPTRIREWNLPRRKRKAKPQ
ncbi:MAG: helix-turn-helix domain-containing protein [Capsulimonadaceae bacterium]|nr:helix-turn-helix domain-containing protein [Capsulimonadaceae bacterium]